jgi:hypothetical protein
MICASAENPWIVDSSRATGRDFWVVDGDANPPFKEYGEMWRLALDRWKSFPTVGYHIYKYVQTTPEIKLEIYTRLLKEDDPNGATKRATFLRQTLLESCGPIKDKDVLKLGWDDPDKECREAARKQVGKYVSWVGVKS